MENEACLGSTSGTRSESLWHYWGYHGMSIQKREKFPQSSRLLKISREERDICGLLYHTRVDFAKNDFTLVRPWNAHNVQNSFWKSHPVSELQESHPPDIWKCVG
jgi:hypothetical protein